MSSALLQCRWFVAGVRDSVSVSSTLIFFVTSRTIRVRSAQCAILNGGLFCVSVLLGESLLRPLLAALVPGHTSASLLLALYYAVWIYPVYVISFALNAIWYADIAAEAIRLSRSDNNSRPNPRRVSVSSVLSSVSEEFYRVLLVGVFCVEIAVMATVPYVGWLLSLVHWCWLYALYSFEYCWAADKWTLAQRLDYFESHWSYFTGFGLPAAVITVAAPSLLSTGLAALAFPLLILLASIATPQPHANTGARVRRLPIFTVAKYANFAVLRVLQRRQQRAQLTPTLNESSNANTAAAAANASTSASVHATFAHSASRYSSSD